MDSLDGRDSTATLPAAAAAQLCDDGFTVLAPGPSAPDIAAIAAAYDAAVAVAEPCDIGGGRTTVRVWDFVNRGPAFDSLYLVLPVLAACRQVIGRDASGFDLAARMLPETLDRISPFARYLLAL
jgi:hypothetical protein